MAKILMENQYHNRVKRYRILIIIHRENYNDDNNLTGVRAVIVKKKSNWQPPAISKPDACDSNFRRSAQSLAVVCVRLIDNRAAILTVEQNEPAVTIILF